MAEEFVDLYEILELPIESDRNTLRKRINELYLDAQRNLDHRNFQTRIKFQELFEVTLPQARYILLDEGRRDDYDRLVRAFRASASGAGAAPAPSPAMPAKPSAPVEPAIPGAAPDIGPLPAAQVDPAQLAKEREELWSKWKTGLESAMSKEKDSDDRPSPAPSASSFSNHSFANDAPATPAPATAAPARPAATAASNTSRPANASAARPAARPAPRVKLAEETSSPYGGLSDEEEKEKAEREAAEKRREAHRRDIMKEVLVNVALIWSSVGAAAIIVPGFIILTIAGNYLFPGGNKPPTVQWLQKPMFWSAGLGILVIGAVFMARGLSKKMRQKTVAELSRMSYEGLIKRTGRG